MGVALVTKSVIGNLSKKTKVRLYVIHFTLEGVLTAVRMEHFNIKDGCGTHVASVLKRRVSCGYKEIISV